MLTTRRDFLASSIRAFFVCAGVNKASLVNNFVSADPSGRVVKYVAPPHKNYMYRDYLAGLRNPLAGQISFHFEGLPKHNPDLYISNIFDLYFEKENIDIEHLYANPDDIPDLVYQSMSSSGLGNLAKICAFLKTPEWYNKFLQKYRAVNDHNPYILFVSVSADLRQYDYKGFDFRNTKIDGDLRFSNLENAQFDDTTQFGPVLNLAEACLDNSFFNPALAA